MATYAIGDVQGCFDELQALLAKISFNPTHDELWIVGDLVNRGLKSLATLRFIKNLPNCKIVLGNHDLHLLAMAYGRPYHSHTLDEILQAPDRDELIHWLAQQPLLHHNAKLNYVMVHAGIPPQWDLLLAKQCARELETVLRSEQLSELLTHMYGNEPNQWSDDLQGWERLRFITHAFTRMRFCTAEGALDFHYTGAVGSQPSQLMPWFKVPHRRNKDLNIIFGHWAALQGEVDEPKIFALDTGCVWGNCLTAMRLEDQKIFNIPCLVQKPY
jgi:bis(5'-nucleosyl)-tetraphosphatase (symmetrical)